MEGRHEKIRNEPEKELLAEDDISQLEAGPSLGDRSEQAARSQSLQRGSNSACSDTQYMERRICMELDKTLKELFKGFEKRFTGLETSVSKIQQDVQDIKSHLGFNSGSLLRQLQPPEVCSEDCENFALYVQTMRNYRPNYGRHAGAKYLSLKVGRGYQTRNTITKFNSLKVCTL